MITEHARSENEVDSLLEEYSYPTMFGEAEVFTLQTDDDTSVRVLYVGGGFQSATFLGEDRFKPVFAYYRAIDFVFAVGRPVSRMLMIGGGGFSYPKHLLMSCERQHGDVCIDVVEIDPAIVGIARRHFFLDELEDLHGPGGSGRLGIIMADGMQALLDGEPEIYDVVVNDSFDGTDPAGTLLSRDALALAKRAMTPGGMYLLNAIAENAEQAAPLVNLLKGTFAHVYLLPCPDEDFDGSSNNLLVASDIPMQHSQFTEL